MILGQGSDAGTVKLTSARTAVTAPNIPKVTVRDWSTKPTMKEINCRKPEYISSVILHHKLGCGLVCRRFVHLFIHPSQIGLRVGLQQQIRPLVHPSIPTRSGLAFPESRKCPYANWFPSIHHSSSKAHITAWTPRNNNRPRPRPGKIISN